MKFFIPNSQYKVLTEISRTSGHYHSQPIYELIDYFDNFFSRKEKIKIFQEFASKIFGDIEKIPKLYILNFYSYPYESNMEISEKFLEKDFLSGFAFYVAKKYLNFKHGVQLDYIKEKEEDSITYYFFDPGLKIFIGKIATKPNDEFSGVSLRVSLSTADDELIGTGYGTKMYLSIIDEIDYLSSDFTLFTGAYRIWKHTLPKYVNVWGVIENEDGIESKKIELSEKKDVRKYDYFVASTHSELR